MSDNIKKQFNSCTFLWDNVACQRQEPEEQKPTDPEQIICVQPRSTNSPPITEQPNITPKKFSESTICVQPRSTNSESISTQSSRTPKKVMESMISVQPHSVNSLPISKPLNMAPKKFTIPRPSIGILPCTANDPPTSEQPNTTPKEFPERKICDKSCSANDPPTSEQPNTTPKKFPERKICDKSCSTNTPSSDKPSRTTTKEFHKVNHVELRSANSPSSKQPITTPEKFSQSNLDQTPSAYSRSTSKQSNTAPKKNFKSTIHIQLRPTDSQSTSKQPSRTPKESSEPTSCAQPHSVNRLSTSEQPDMVPKKFTIPRPSIRIQPCTANDPPSSKQPNTTPKKSPEPPIRDKPRSANSSPTKKEPKITPKKSRQNSESKRQECGTSTNTVTTFHQRTEMYIIRKKWKASAAKDSHKPLTTKPVPYVIISQVNGERLVDLDNDNTTKIMTNEQLLQRLQYNDMNKDDLVDIKCNFYISKEGFIYEGRGWGNSTCHLDDYNGKSVAIALIGTFNTSPPSDAQLSSLKKLLKIGVNYKEIHAQYHLKSEAQKEQPGYVNSRKLYNIICHWEHWSPGF